MPKAAKTGKTGKTAKAKTGSDKLDTYRSMRSADKTPEPVPEPGDLPEGNDDTFVIQEHHASALHWDFRLERDGVLVSWALPKGLPNDPKVNHLAIHTEDHPLEYASFHGEIPAGEYGGGKVMIWDSGHYETQKWRKDEVIVVLHGHRSSGRFALFQTSGKQWMIHRMDGPVRADWEPMPNLLRPMMASPSKAPPLDNSDWAFEMKWDGIRAVVYIDGGRVERAMTRNDRDIKAGYPELAAMAKAIGARPMILDGEIVALKNGRPDFSALQQRMHVTSPTAIRTLAAQTPVSFLAFDLLYLEGKVLTKLTYDQRRERLEALELNGPNWATPPAFVGTGEAALESSSALGLEGVVAKLRRSCYEPGKRSRDWIKLKNFRTQEVIIAGWSPGKGHRTGTIGALILALPVDGELTYVGKVGTGFTAASLASLAKQFAPLHRADPAIAGVPRAIARDATWLEPELVGEVAYTEFTQDGNLRHPSWRGLRPDKSPSDVIRED